MPPTHSETTSDSGFFFTALESGNPGWARLGRFPPENSAGPTAERELRSLVDFVRDAVDAEEVDRAGALPPDLTGRLAGRGLFKLRLPPELGGLGLNDHDAFRVVERICRHSVAVGQLVAIQNAVGANALLAALPPGELHDFVARRVAEGALSGFAGTEPSGANNAWPATTATLTADGTAYEVHGEKLFTGAGSVAEVLAITATVRDGGPDRVGVLFFDTGTPGFEVTARLQFMGSRGLPNAALRFDGLRVPRAHALLGEPGDPRFPGRIGPVAQLSALFFNAAPAVAIATQCLRWSREFVARRTVNGRPLGDYDQIQRALTAALAEVYAIDTVVRRCLLGPEAAGLWFERALAKNICTLTAWRVVDRAVSLLGGEGFETAASKAARGADPLPLERLLRDARGLRISGNVDFLLDVQAGRLLLARLAAAPGPQAEPAESTAVPGARDEPDDLTPANRDHRRAALAGIRRLREHCLALIARNPEQEQLFARQETLALIGRISAELFTISALLARTNALGPASADAPQLADVYCAAARSRLGGLWRELLRDAETEPDHAKISRAWLTEARLDFPLDL